MTTPTLEELCRDAWIAEGLSDKTIAAYALVIRRAEHLLAEMGTTLVAATPTEVRALAASWPRTRSSRIQLRVALARAWEVAGRPAGPALAIAVPSKPRYRCRALPEASAASLAATAASHGGPDGLAVLLGLYAGLRRSEIAALEWCQVAPGWLRIVGKGEVTREVPIHPRLSAALEARRAEIGGRWVFPGRKGSHVTPTTIWTWSRRIGELALVGSVPTHVLRHTAIATLNDATADLRAAQIFAGHASSETTEIYTRVSTRRLVAAVESITYGDAS